MNQFFQDSEAEVSWLLTISCIELLELSTHPARATFISTLSLPYSLSASSPVAVPRAWAVPSILPYSPQTPLAIKILASSATFSPRRLIPKVHKGNHTFKNNLLYPNPVQCLPTLRSSSHLHGAHSLPFTTNRIPLKATQVSPLCSHPRDTLV